MAKAAVHQLCQSLAAKNSGMPSGAAAVAILPWVPASVQCTAITPEGGHAGGLKKEHHSGALGSVQVLCFSSHSHLQARPIGNLRLSVNGRLSFNLALGQNRLQPPTCGPECRNSSDRKWMNGMKERILCIIYFPKIQNSSLLPLASLANITFGPLGVFISNRSDQWAFQILSSNNHYNWIYWFTLLKSHCMNCTTHSRMTFYYAHLLGDEISWVIVLLCNANKHFSHFPGTSNKQNELI